MSEHLVHALADLREAVLRQEARLRADVRRLPCLAAVLRPEDARRGDPIHSCFASSGSSVIEWVINPPAPGDHFSRVS
jgi:hypothetical protein